MVEIPHDALLDAVQKVLVAVAVADFDGSEPPSTPSDSRRRSKRPRTLLMLTLTILRQPKLSVEDGVKLRTTLLLTATWTGPCLWKKAETDV